MGARTDLDVLGFSRVARTIRAAVIVLALCAFLAAESSADEPPPGLNPRVTVLNISGALILTFKSRPPQGKAAEILVDKLENAGFRLAERFPRLRSWTLKPHEWPGPSISRVCSELMRDDKIRSLLASCEPDILIRPVDSRKVDEEETNMLTCSEGAAPRCAPGRSRQGHAEHHNSSAGGGSTQRRYLDRRRTRRRQRCVTATRSTNSGRGSKTRHERENHDAI